MFAIKTDFGTIRVTKSIIARIVVEAIEGYEGKVILTNQKGKAIIDPSKNKALGIASKIGVADESTYMEITKGKNGIDIRFYILLKFGTSIAETTNHLIDTIRSEMIATTGSEPNSVSVMVKGMFSKNIAKRSIEVKR